MLAIPQAYYSHARESCYRCGSGGPGVDMDTHIEGEGSLFICTNCIGEAGQVAGLIVRKPKAQK